MPPWLSAALVVAGCAVLTWAGLEKARDRQPLASTARALGLPSGVATSGATIVPLVELGTVLAVLAGAPPAVPFVLFVALGVGFAGAAAWSMATRRNVACACFGASERRLGWPQLVSLPLWLAAAWSTTALPHTGARQRLEIFCTGMLILTAARAVQVIRRGIGARGDRRAMVGG
jgi:Methylamine utilisation protein MauE